MCCLLIEAFACYVLEKFKLYGPSFQNKNVTALRIELLSNESTIIAIIVNSKGNVTINSCNSAQDNFCKCRLLAIVIYGPLNHVKEVESTDMLRHLTTLTLQTSWPPGDSISK